MDALRLRGSPFARFGIGSSAPSNSNSNNSVKSNQEPLIVVEESNMPEEEQDSSETRSSNRGSLDIDSPLNPYLLSPWRDPREGRKHSLPSQQVTDGITASQVRRLSERGGEGSGPSPKETAFLATLSQAPAPSGRRHSVVIISKVVPTSLLGRSRRESVAAYPTNGRILSSRRESNAGPPSTTPIGSIHNLQLDVMDDIVQSRKARMTLWNTSKEKVCEVQTVDEVGNGTPSRYTNRRYSECPPQPGSQSVTPLSGYRRSSEHPASISPQPPGSNRTSTKRKKSIGGGLLGSRTDLASIFNNLTSSAIEIHKYDETPPQSAGITPSSNTTGFTSNTFNAALSARGKTTTGATLGVASTIGSSSAAGSSSNMLDPNEGRSTRSNSFDVSILNNAKQLVSDAQDNSSAALSGWFTKRHEPMARKKSVRSKSTVQALSKDMLDRLQKKDPLGDSKPKLKPRSKQKSWADATKANLVDATMIGSAIEGFLRKGSTSSAHSTAPGGSSSRSASTGRTGGGGGGGASTSRGAVPKETAAGSRHRSRTSTPSQASRAVRSTLNWFGKGDEDDSKDTCDASLCATLKDLFVK